MDPWSNIEISAQDPEINKVNRFETNLGEITSPVRKIRELITRFEVCHFKYQKHLKYIQDSIINLNPISEPGKIGSNHISKGENAWRNDKSGRSLLGQQYLWGLEKWLYKTISRKNQKEHNEYLEISISRWLGKKTPDKVRIVKLLVARLTYNWETCQKLQLGGQFSELELQTCKMDICHYAFPGHLNSLIRAIGKMKPLKDLEGCGSYNSEIKICLTQKYFEIASILDEILKNRKQIRKIKNDQLRIWLYLCLAKTIKEQIGISNSLPIIN